MVPVVVVVVVAKAEERGEGAVGNAGVGVGIDANIYFKCDQVDWRTDKHKMDSSAYFKAQHKALKKIKKTILQQELFETLNNYSIDAWVWDSIQKERLQNNVAGWAGRSSNFYHYSPLIPCSL